MSNHFSFTPGNENTRILSIKVLIAQTCRNQNL